MEKVADFKEIKIKILNLAAHYNVSIKHQSNTVNSYLRIDRLQTSVLAGNADREYNGVDGRCAELLPDRDRIRAHRMTGIVIA